MIEDIKLTLIYFIHSIFRDGQLMVKKGIHHLLPMLKSPVFT